MELLIAILSFILWVVSGVIASRRERSVIGWLLLGVFISGFITVVLLLMLPNKRKLRLAAEAKEEAKEDQRRREHMEIVAALAGRSNGANR